MKFFINNIAPITLLKGEEVNHIKNVLRKSIGDEIIICDGKNTDYLCRIENLGKKEIALKIIKSYPTETESHLDLTLYQGLLKSPKQEMVIQKAVELGVGKITFMETERSVAKAAENKLTRWEKIAKTAAMQSERGIIPAIDFTDFAQALEDFASTKILAYEKAEQRDFGNITDTVALYIGPEGGFSQREIDKAAEKNIRTLSLGKSILRSETAAIAACSIVFYLGS